MFQTRPNSRPFAFRILLKVCVVLLSVYLMIGLISAYRAWYQVASLELKLSVTPDPESTVTINGRKKAVVETKVVSYARGPVDVRLELIQGERGNNFYPACAGERLGIF